jgi:hypothetical protein
MRLDGVRTDFAMMQTADGNGRLRLIKFHSPPTQGTTGMRRPTHRASAISHS